MPKEPRPIATRRGCSHHKSFLWVAAKPLLKVEMGANGAIKLYAVAEFLVFFYGLVKRTAFSYQLLSQKGAAPFCNVMTI